MAWWYALERWVCRILDLVFEFWFAVVCLLFGIYFVLACWLFVCVLVWLMALFIVLVWILCRFIGCLWFTSVVALVGFRVLEDGVDLGLFGGYGSLVVCCRLSLFLVCLVGFGLLVCVFGWLFGVLLLWCYDVWCFSGWIWVLGLLVACWFRLVMLCILVCDLSCVFLV